jgi:hypothetical protein
MIKYLSICVMILSETSMYYTVFFKRTNKFNLPNIVPVATGIVVGKKGVVSTAVTGTGVVTPIQIYIFYLTYRDYTIMFSLIYQ